MLDFDEMKKKRVVYEIPGMDQTRRIENHVYKRTPEGELHLDAYYPAELRADEQRPAVLLVHGLGSADTLKDIKNWGQYVAWGQLIAASGLIAVTFNHRSDD